MYRKSIFKKITLCIFIMLFIFFVVYLCSNFKAVKTWLTGGQIYTQSQLDEAEQKGYDKALADIVKIKKELASEKNNNALLSKQLEELKASDNAKAKDIAELEAQLENSNNTILSLQNELLQAFDEAYNSGYTDGLTDKDKSYTVIFYDENDEVLETNLVNAGSTLAEFKIEEPTLFGYAFKGWSLDKVNVLNDDYLLNQSINLYPIFEDVFNGKFIYTIRLTPEMYSTKDISGTITISDFSKIKDSHSDTQAYKSGDNVFYFNLSIKQSVILTYNFKLKFTFENGTWTITDNGSSATGSSSVNIVVMQFKKIA